MSEREAPLLKTVTHALDMLRAVAEQPDQSIGALAARLGLSRSSAHRILQTLVREGFLSYDRAKAGYQLGFELVRLGGVAEQQSALLEKAQPYLRTLAEQTQETTMLFIRRGTASSLILAGVDGPQAIRYAVRVGDSVGLHAGAGSKALLAHLPDEEIEAVLAEPLRRYTEWTIVEPARLREELAEIRERGWSFSEAEVTPHSRAVGAPILDSSGFAVASVSLTAPAARMADDEIEPLAAAVAAATAELSRELGWTAPAAAGAPSR